MFTHYGIDFFAGCFFDQRPGGTDRGTGFQLFKMILRTGKRIIGLHIRIKAAVNKPQCAVTVFIGAADTEPAENALISVVVYVWHIIRRFPMALRCGETLRFNLIALTVFDQITIVIIGTAACQTACGLRPSFRFLQRKSCVCVFPAQGRFV